MRTTARAGLAGALALCSTLGCTSAAVQDDAPSSGGAGGDGARESALPLAVGPDSRTFVDLAGPSLVEVKGNGESSIAWDIALQGRDVFVNGGVSGPGDGSAFGPLAAPT